MISIDEHQPPDPSSSDNHNHQQQHQVSHEAFPSVSEIDLLKLSDANLDDTNNSYQLPRFSIRDYVFESRTKNIARNWPFSDKSFQLCLNYGVKNILPPFQSLDSLRNYSSVNKCALENHSSNDGTICNLDSQTSYMPQFHLEEELAHTKSNSQPSVKKYCKLVMKLNSVVESIEETVSASKVCPVCKTFSSSSNTTLNAHIDSCLSEESNMKLSSDLKLKIVKHRIKPRKTRLMVDIYKTAHCCTIEELDKRNGTNWAMNSSFPDQEHEFQVEEKKKEPQEPTFVSEVADHEGAVYIDKNGKKVRLLSMLKPGNLDDDGASMLQKGRKGSKLIIKKKMKKKTYMQKDGKKILKVSKKAESGQKENVSIKENRKNEDGGVKPPMKAQVNKQMDDLAITRPPWACSKRTVVAKKLFKRTEETLLDDSCENVIRPKGSKFSSLKKSLSMPTSRGHNAGSKLVKLKRKSSAIEMSQDSLKLKSRTEEEDLSKKMSFETVNVSDVKRKKSVTSSKSSNDDDSLEGTEDLIGFETNFTGLKNSEESISQPDEHALAKLIIEHNTNNQGNFFEEADPILIPGPPGSFLPPSPGADMGSEEEPHANSSLTTMSRVHESSDQDHLHHDIMNQDFISGSSISTVSSPSFARTADKLSSRFENKYVNNNNNISNNSSDLRSVDASYEEKGPTPCCCSRKEGAFFENLASYTQESTVSKERVTESNGLTSELFPIPSHLILPSPNMVRSPVLSPTTPVLRLMGKNLTVVNTNDEQVKPLSSSSMSQHHQLQNFINENRDAFIYGHPHQSRIIFNPNQNGSMNHGFNPYPPNNPRICSDIRSANTDINATKEIIVIDDSSENEGDEHHHHHMFKEPMIRNHAFGFANPYGNGSLQTSSPSRGVANGGNHGRRFPTAYYPHTFLDQLQVKEKMDRV